MTRRSIFAAVFASPVRSQPVDELRERAIKFEKYWNPFLRALFGCPESGDTNADTCKLPRAEIKYGEFLKARAEACKLFDLKD